MKAPDLVLHNGKITTLDPSRPEVSALAIFGDRIAAVGGEDLLTTADEKTTRIDLNGRRAVPGLNDSHIHVIRGGLNYNMELRWDGVPSLADALAMLKEQARRTPPPQWVRVIGGWSEFQFAEKRMPTLQEINEVAPDTPVFVLHLYARALLNSAALRALGYDKNTPNPPGGLVERDKNGNPTGLLIAEPNALILYASIARGPKLSFEDQLNSSRQFMRELNRLGLTSAIDAGGGGQNYPEDYKVIEELHKNSQMTVRIAYNLFAQKPGEELADYRRWVEMTQYGSGSDVLRLNGGGENLVWSAADFENFLQVRPDLLPKMEEELQAVVRVLAEKRWPFRIHATYDESISRFLNIFEKIDGEIPFDGMHWFIDHAETISERNLERVKALGGGIAIQDRMAFQGEYFIRRYGIQAVETAPPIRRMLKMGVPVGGGTDATRVASYNPWISLYWLATGKTVDGTPMYQESNRLTREEALRLWTKGSAWFSAEDGQKGEIREGQLADLVVLTEDYLTVTEEKIKGIESVLTVLGGKIVYGAKEFAPLAPPPLPFSPDWSPAGRYGGYYHGPAFSTTSHHGCLMHAHTQSNGAKSLRLRGLACDCFTF
jgi:predicted amidohydrolase YtcJ